MAQIAIGFANFNAICTTPFAAFDAGVKGKCHSSEEVETIMMKIGNRKIEATYTLLLPKGESAQIPVNVRGWQFDLKIEFDNTQENQGVNIAPIENGAKITFVKWDSGIGTALKTPGTLARVFHQTTQAARKPDI